jgi:hypothetical protein
MASPSVPRTEHDRTGRPDAAAEEFIARADVRALAADGDRLLRLLAPRLAEETALGRYVRGLLAGGRWEQVHIVPHRENGQPSNHVFDLYGVRSGRPG